MTLNLLSIAGSDPSGGAGVQADLKTFSALGCYGMAAVTALTSQNTRGVSGVHVPPAEFVAQQIDTIFADIEVAAVKIGVLATGAIAETVADRLTRHAPGFVVLDPVLVATSGDSLGAPDVLEAMRDSLFSLADLITPNLLEAARLAGAPSPHDLAGLKALAERLYGAGARAVLVKGGHLSGDESHDVLFDGSSHHVFSARRIVTNNTHGTGCTLSSAIAVFLAKGFSLPDAVDAAKRFLTAALAESDRLSVGGGHGPVHHFHALWASSEQLP